MERTVDRTVTNEKELLERLGLPPRRESDTRPIIRRRSLSQYGQIHVQGRAITFEHAPVSNGHKLSLRSKGDSDDPDTKKPYQAHHKGRRHRKERLLLLQEEKDRFDAMRIIQNRTHRFQQYYSLMLSFLAFTILWFVGAVVFWRAEHREQDLSYFQALYFCYVSLLTIGYGDLSPKSNAGKSKHFRNRSNPRVSEQVTDSNRQTIFCRLVTHRRSHHYHSHLRHG